MSTLQSDKRLLAETRDLLRRLHYSIHTEKAYCDWIARYVRFHQLQRREELLDQSEQKVEAFLTWLSTERHVSAPTQNQALNALVFAVQTGTAPAF